LVRNFERPVPHEALWEAVWGRTPLTIHTLRVLVSRLRLKLLPYGLNIIPMFRVGYRLIRAADEEAQ
jgi:DNA-binding winged helix-turn-helix (wHTH) protein